MGQRDDMVTKMDADDANRIRGEAYERLRTHDDDRAGLEARKQRNAEGEASCWRAADYDPARERFEAQQAELERRREPPKLDTTPTAPFDALRREIAEVLRSERERVDALVAEASRAAVDEAMREANETPAAMLATLDRMGDEVKRLQGLLERAVAPPARRDAGGLRPWPLPSDLN
jgi:hypothetical protein